MSIGSRMFERRAALGLRQKDVAERVTAECKRMKIKDRQGYVTCSQTAIGQYERPTDDPRHRTPKIHILPALANVLGVSIVWLITGKDESEIPSDIWQVSKVIVGLPRAKLVGLSLLLDTPLLDTPPELIRSGAVPDVKGDSRHATKRANR